MKNKLLNKSSVVITNSFWIWVGTIVSFLLLMAYSKDKWSSLETRLFFTNIGLGIVAFIVMSVFVLLRDRGLKKRKRNKPNKLFSVEKNLNGLFIALIMILLVPIISFAGPILEEQKSNGEKQKTGESNSKVISSPSTVNQVKNETNQVIVSVDCIGPDGKQFKTSESECRELNETWGKELDYMVNCNVNSNCGGGTTYIKKSECDNSTCCKIGDKWIFYKDKNKCNKDQKSNQPSYNYPTYTYPTTNDTNINQPVNNSDYNRDQQSICKGDARRNYQTQEAQLRTYYRARGGGLSGAYENAVNQLYSDLQRAISNCKRQYPY